MHIPMREKYVDEHFPPLFEYGSTMGLVDLADVNNITVISLPRETAEKVLAANKEYMEKLYKILC